MLSFERQPDTTPVDDIGEKCSYASLKESTRRRENSDWTRFLLIEESLAASRPAEAGNTVIAVPLSFELVIISQLLI